MTKMAYMPIYGKTPSKIVFYGTGVPISRKCDLSTTMGLKIMTMLTNHDHDHHDHVDHIDQFYGKVNVGPLYI